MEKAMFLSCLVVALIASTDAACSFPRNIDFEDCIYPSKNAASSGFDWVAQSAGNYQTWRRRQGGALRVESIDHTLSNKRGNFMAVFRSNGNVSATGVIQRDFTSPVYNPPDGSVCSLSFWLRHELPIVTDVLSVFVIQHGDQGPQQTLLTRFSESAITESWSLHTIRLSSVTAKFQLVFRAEMEPFPMRSVDQALIAIDDIKFSSDCCRLCRAAPRVDLECGLQGYNVAAQGGTTPWQLFNGGSGSASTGPSNDNTFGSRRGHYLLLPSLNHPNSVAALESPEYKPTGAVCNVSFAYHMKGAGIGNLTVVFQNMSSNGLTRLWVRQGEQGADWIVGSVAFSSPSKYKLRFIAHTTSDARGDIALDDIVMSSGCCVGASAIIEPVRACTNIGYDTRVQRGKTDRHNGEFIDESLQFACNGTVFAWKLHTTAAANYTMKIWRKVSSTPAEFLLIDEETVQILAGGRHIIPSTKGMQFEAGDVIGWRGLSGGRLQASPAQAGSVVFARYANIIPTLIYGKPAFRFNSPENPLLKFSVSAMIHPQGVNGTPPVITTTPLSIHSSPAATSTQEMSASMTTPPLAPVTSTPPRGTNTTISAAVNKVSEPIYPWVIMGLVLLGIILVMIIVLAHHIRTHRYKMSNKSPAHRRRSQGDASQPHSNGHMKGSGMKLSSIEDSPAQQRTELGLGAQYPTTPAMLELSRPTLACETKLPSPGFMTVPTPSVMKAFPGMTISQGCLSFSAMPEYSETSPELTDSSGLNTTQENSLEDTASNHVLESAEHSRENSSALVSMHSRQESSLTDIALADVTEVSLHGDTLSTMTSDTPSKKSGSTTMTDYEYRSRSKSEGTRSMCSRPYSRSDVIHRSIDSPFRMSMSRRTPYAEPLDAVGKSSSRRHFSSPYQEPALTVPGIFAQLKSGTYKCLQRDKIDVQAIITHGSQCGIHAGVWKKGSVDVPVAVKTVYPRKEGDYMPFLREATILGQFSHRNIVQLFGVVMDNSGKAPQLILELMSDNLKNYLIGLRPSGSNLPEVAAEHLCEHQLNMCLDVASGMAYLEAKGFVHRDLAARNVMIGSDRVCKIGDFSLCRDMAAPDSLAVSRNTKFPIKWAAPEVLKHYKFTAASDVWSYGVLLYEIWSLGMMPYGDMPNDKVVGHLDAGNRLSSPVKCPLAVYEIMTDCWHPFSMDRPSFSQVVQILEMTDRNILLGQIPPPPAGLIYDEAIDIKPGDDESMSKMTPAEHLQRRYVDFPKEEPIEKRGVSHSRHGSLTAGQKPNCLPRHMLAEQVSLCSHGSIDTGSSSVTSV